MVSKLCINSLDVHYIKQLYERACTKDVELMNGKLLKEDALAWSEAIEKELTEWITQKAEPNLVELSKKKVDLHSKWENFVTF